MHKLRPALRWAVTFAGFWPPLLQAAEASFHNTQQHLLTQLEELFPEQQMAVRELATTDRFVLLYATHAGGTNVTVTLRQLPQQADRIDLTVITDSPRDVALETDLVNGLRARLRASEG
jgi:hypothetical protein